MQCSQYNLFQHYRSKSSQQLQQIVNSIYLFWIIISMIRLKTWFEIAFLIVAAVLLLTLALLVALVGKNLTYTTRFTPPSTEKALKNQSYYTQSQVIIMLAGGLLMVLLPIFIYTVFIKSKRFFIPIWATYLSLVVILLLTSLYYLTGSQGYRDYLSQISSIISNSAEYCQQSLCNKATCVRMQSFKQSRQMTQAFCVIGTLSSLYMLGVGFFINLRRRRTNQIELIM